MSVVGVAGLAQLVTGCAEQRAGSVSTTASTAQALAGGGYVIDFVADCGADPTGIDDCGPALVTAGQKLKALAADPRMAANSAVLDIPPGLYRVHSSPGLWNFLGGVSNILIRGYKDASIFICDRCPDSIFNLGNCSVTFENLTFVGTDSYAQGIPDCTSVIELGYVDLGIIRECKFIYLWAGGPSLGVIYTAYSTVRIVDSQFLASVGNFGTVVAGAGTIALSLLRTRFIDYGVLNQFTFPQDVSAKLQYTSSWLRVLGCNTKECRVEVHQCYFDEGVLNTIRVDAGPTKIRKVRISECFINIPTQPGKYSLTQFAGVHLLEIDTVSTNVASGNPDVPAIQLSSVDVARVRGWTQDTYAQARYIAADQTVQYLRVEHCDFGAADIRSQASTVEVKLFAGTAEVETVLGVAKSATSVGSVLKVAEGSGGGLAYDLLCAADGVGAAVGVAVDAVAGGSNVRIAKPGQRVSALSDGSSSINIGDSVAACSSTTAGQVAKAVQGSPTIGIAMSAAAAGTPVMVDVFLQPGSA